jgi:hypothetical protein
MLGQFRRIGNTVFPGAEPEIPCGLYEWRGTISDEIAEFAIRFISPEGAVDLRQYWVEPILDAWVKKDKKRKKKSTAFLEKACEVGHEIVAALNNHSPEQREVYRLAAWLFRNRNVGHMGVTREFKSAADFFDFSNPQSPVLLLPGLGVNQTDRRWAGTEAPGTARQLLAEAVGSLRERMAEQGETLPKVTLNFSGVLDLFDRLLSREPPTQATNPMPLVCIDEKESLFILPVLEAANPQTNFRDIESTVADCLIYGPAGFSENLDVLAAHPEQYEYLVGQLSEKLVKPSMTPEKLDAWLKRIKRDGYLQLVEGGRNLQEDDREEARELASQMMSAVTWCAYRMMGRCYGALMEVVAEDLEQNEPELSSLEGVIFRLEHCQIDILAGLPLDFLERAQFRWIVDKWHDLLAAVVSRNLGSGSGHDPSDALRKATTRLELFAYLLRERRDADRLAKRRSARSIDWLTRKPPRDEFREEYIRQKSVGSSTHPKEIEDTKTEQPDAAIARTDMPEITPLTSEFCPICGSKIEVDKPIDLTDTTRALFWGLCPLCDNLKVYVANLDGLDELKRTRQRTR